MDKWVLGIFILVLILFFGFSILDSQVSTAGQVTPEIASNCPANQFATAENATGGFNCATALTTQTAVSTEASATCPIGKDAQNESANGSFMCGYPTSLHGTFPYGNLTGFPAACTSGMAVTAIGSSLTCHNVPLSSNNCAAATCDLGSQCANTCAVRLSDTVTQVVRLPHPVVIDSFYIANNGTVTSAVCPNTVTGNDFLYVAGVQYTAPGAPGSCYQLASGYALFVWADGSNINWYGIPSRITWASLTGFPASCASGQFVNTNGLTNTCSGILNDMTNNTKSCADVTSGTVKQMGFKLNFTTTYSTNVSVTVNFQITTPATITLNTKYRLSYGTGSAPACNAAQTGTGIGNQYELLSFGGTAATTWSQIEQFSLTAVIQNPTANTAYWVDIQALDSSSATWTFALPTMTVVQG